MAVASLSMLTFLVPAEKFLIYFLLLYISSGKMCRFSLIKKDRISFGNVIKNYFMVHSSRKLPKIQKHTTRDKEIFPSFHVQTKEIKSVDFFFALTLSNTHTQIVNNDNNKNDKYACFFCVSVSVLKRWTCKPNDDTIKIPKKNI